MAINIPDFNPEKDPNVAQNAFTIETDNSTVFTKTKVVDKDVLSQYYNGPFGLEYVGARYVPIFADPVEWNKQGSYEPLTIVTYQGTSYTSRCEVPVGVDITNEHYWAKTGDYNAQVEAYRKAVEQYKNEVESKLPELEQALEEGLGAIETNTQNSIQRVKDAAGQYTDLPDEIEDITKALDYAYNDNENIYIFSDSTFQTIGSVKGIWEYMRDLSNANIINRGVSGKDVNYFIDIINAYNESELKDATQIIVALGINNYQNSAYPITLNNETYTNLKFFDNAYRIFLTKLIELAPQAEIVCVTPAYIYRPATVLNSNECGVTYKVYCDVIRNICKNFNIAVLSLDQILGVNIKTYLSKFDPSGNIYVHHKEYINKLIAKLLLLKKWDNPNTTQSYLDITPIGWNYDYRTIYDVGKFNGNNIKRILTTDTLTAGIEYWFSCVCGNVKVYLDDTLIATSNVQSVIQVPFTVPTTKAYQLRFETTNTAAIPFLGNLTLSVGRPDIYEVMNKKINYSYQEKTTDEYDMYFNTIGRSYMGQINFKKEFTPPHTPRILSIDDAPMGLYGSKGCYIRYKKQNEDTDYSAEGRVQYSAEGKIDIVVATTLPNETLTNLVVMF